MSRKRGFSVVVVVAIAGSVAALWVLTSNRVTMPIPGAMTTESAEPVLAPECNTNADCNLLDEFCAKADGDCNGGGTCEIRPDVCLQVWDPVCGCDDNTYSNACVAASNGVSVASEGECDDGGGGCAGKNEPCNTNSDCCSNKCKPNGKCR